MGRSASIYLGDGRWNKSDFYGYNHEFRVYLDPIHPALYSQLSEYDRYAYRRGGSQLHRTR